MGRKHRSASFNYSSTTTTTTTKSSTRHNNDIPNQELQACSTLLRHFVHSENKEGRTPFYCAVGAAASSFNCRAVTDHESNCNNNDNNNNNEGGEYDNNEERKRLDGLFVVDTLATRMKEMDALESSAVLLSRKKKVGQHAGNYNNSSNNNSISSGSNNSNSSGGHFYQLMTTRDRESGYTPLHHAILKRNMMTLLLLLKHASVATLEEQEHHGSIGGGLNNSNNMTSLNLHPLRLLDGNNLNNNDDNSHNNNNEDNPYHILNTITSMTDKEGLTPLQLLGKTSSNGLECCRRTLTWRALREGWMMQRQQQQQSTRRRGEQQQQQQVDGISTALSRSFSVEETSPPSGGRYRSRMISFGDDRDYDSLHYDIDAGDTQNDNERRGRGGSFHLNLEDDHSDDDSGDHIDPLEDVDFNELGVNEEDETTHAAHRHNSHTNNDYGCEVLTFGRADHCALGVPQLSSRIRDNYSSSSKGGKDDHNSNIFSSSSFDKTYKPRRVEAFALGELRRAWSSSSSTSGNLSRGGRRNGIDSPAVAVAASTHHTLVTTRSGQVYSFGLGKGGRLGLGDESHRPLPTRILGPLSKRIVASIAAAENHSLCSTSDGAVFAWGSNGFGQLGIHSSRGSAPQSQDGSAGGGSRLSPRRVEGELKNSFVVGVACGERHSVALTRLGEVYCWGDNKKGQLGVINVSETQSNGPQRVESLWAVNPRRRAIAISAAAYSTLVLTMPPTVSAGAERESSLASLPVNQIYGWGHGNHTPMRVVFPSGDSFASQSSSSNAYSRMICINPTAIACAKYHNVAITKDGKVYTWGLHSDSLGVPQQASLSKQRSRSGSVSGSSSSSMITSPQLVTGMLPENGGGNAVAVSASESHTAIVTSDGHLFTWGESEGKDVLGHKGVRWQPSPRRVKRVHRAVAVAAGKEHTVMLIGTNFPLLPSANSADGPLSLQVSSAVEISRNVDLFNVIPLALAAYRFNCRPLINYCDAFIRNNLDGVLAVGMKTDFDAFLSSRTIIGTNDYERDGLLHPFLHLVVNTRRWVYSGRTLLKQYESTIVPPAKKLKRNSIQKERKPSVSLKDEESKPNEAVQRVTKAPSDITQDEIAPQRKESVTPSETKRAPETESKAKHLPVPSARGKYYCKLCGISCPDSDSFTFHIHGRKHRNREKHAEAAEEKNVAESMMAMKRMQLIERSGEEYSRIAFEREKKQDAKSNIAWGAQHANFSGGLSPVTPQKGRSFQDILKEEQQSMAMSTAHSRKGQSPPSMGAKSPASATPVKLKNSISIPSPITRGKNSPLNTSTFAASPTLGSFIERKAEPKNDGVSRIGASWGASPTASKARNSNLNWGLKQPAKAASPLMTQSHSKARSFSEIQKEEEAIRNNEDHMCRIDGNQWFVQQRERAASIGEIQQQEKQEQEMLDLIEEQRQIELAIMRSIQEENDAKKSQQKKKHPNHQRRKKKKPPSKTAAKEKGSTPS